MNLDCMSIDELWGFWERAHRPRPIRLARELFSERPNGYVRATRDLGCYAANKATAMRCREEGNIKTALVYERICDNIYDRLPKYAKW